MPTGYTAAVVDGTVTDLKTFALQCARGMGALITADTEYHDRELSTARARLSELEGMDLAARTAATEAYNAEVEARNEKSVAENTEQRNRYNSMIAQVVKWKGAPEGIKEFMLDQLHRGRDFDCHDNPTEFNPKPLAVSDWYREELRKATWAIGYHEGERAKEIARTAERNAWLRQLHDSLAEAT